MIDKPSEHHQQKQPAEPQISVPAGWSEVYEHRIAEAKIEMFQKTGQLNIEIGIKHDHIHDAQSMLALRSLLSSHSALQHPTPLKSDEIRKLQPVMGYSTIGDNQFTNASSIGSRYSPTFNLQSADVLPINGRNVLAVNGNFLDQNGTPITSYRGIYFSVDGQHVENIFLQAPYKREGLSALPDYERMIKSLKWTDPIAAGAEVVHERKR